MNEFLVFRVRDNAPTVLRMRESEQRGRHSLELLRRLIARDPERFDGLTGIINYGNRPPAAQVEWRECDLHFCTTSVAGQRQRHLPFPCCRSLGWPAVGIEDGDALMARLLDRQEPFADPRAFWTGAETHPARRALVELGARHRDILDCELTSWDRANPERLTCSNYVSLWEHRRYKYLIDCPGDGYSARLKWLLASGRPVLVVERDYVEPWHEALVPWQHYVPVRADLIDLLTARTRLEEDPKLSARIGQQAKKFAREHLLLDRQLDAALLAVPPVKSRALKFTRPRSDVRVTRVDQGHDETAVYDLNVQLPVCCADKYRRRLEQFKSCGLFGLEGYRVHLTLLGSENDWCRRAGLRAGWPQGCAVSVLAVNQGLPLPKINAGYLWQRQSALRARWHLRVDDDSMTDVGGLLRWADRHYGATPIHLMTSPYYNDHGLQTLLAYFLLRGIELPMVAHEHESSLTSDAALRQMFADEQAVDFLQHSLVYVHQPGDQALALAMIAAGVPVAANPVTTKDPATDQMSLAGGPLFHIHYVDWDDPDFTALSKALLHGKRRPLALPDAGMYRGRPLPFGRGLGQVSAKVTLAEDGLTEGVSSKDEAMWAHAGGALRLTRADGVATTVFDTLLEEGHGAWLLGTCLADATMRFLRLR